MTAGGVHSDRELWRRARACEHDAFGLLFDRHANAVYNHVFRRTASWSEAEDLTSAVFLEAWRRRREVVLDRDSALPWLLGVATYLTLNRQRALRRYRALTARLPQPRPAPDHADEVAARVDDERVMSQLRSEIARLPRRDQEVIELCLWAGLDQRAAAVALRVPVGTVKSRLSRARARLASQVGYDGRSTAVQRSTVEKP
jgi:RNA polymerase sigma-70 factor (ECF subfamily)